MYKRQSFGSVFSLVGGVVEFDSKGGLHAVAVADHKVDVFAIDFVSSCLIFMRLSHKEEVTETDFGDEGITLGNERFENVIKTEFSIGEEFVALAVGEGRRWGRGGNKEGDVFDDESCFRFAKLCLVMRTSQRCVPTKFFSLLVLQFVRVLNRGLKN